MSESKTMVILGASGDLTKRLLLPGIGSLIAGADDADLALLAGLRLIGSGRSDHSRAQWQDEVRTAFEGVEAKGDLAEALIRDADYVVGDPTADSTWDAVLQHDDGALVVYFALPPSVVAKVAAVLTDRPLPDDTVLALEKPFGENAAGAAHLNAELAKVVPEDRIHRVDHFLGHRAVLATLALRFNNRMFQPIWNAGDVERVEISYDEQLGLENRAGYYDGNGALRDMLQSHLLQVLSVVATEPPAAVNAVELRDATAAALRATRVWSGAPIFPNTDAPSRRARYTAGEVDGHALPSYVDEQGVDPSRHTETLAEIALEVDTERWAGVPFVLRSGKAIGDPKKTISLTLRPVRHRPADQEGEATPERIVLTFRPPSLSIELTAGGGDMPFELEEGDVSGPLAKSAVTEYGEVVRGVLGNDPTLSVRGDVAVRCWEIVQPILDAWAADEVPLDEYAAGSDGPSSWS